MLFKPIEPFVIINNSTSKQNYNKKAVGNTARLQFSS
jgi:hypothetical protein